MSGVYSYCVLRTGHHPPAGLEGLGGTPVRGHDVGPFTVWVSAEEAVPALDLDRVARHHEVVRAAAATAATLPMRFGAWTPDHSGLDARIERNRSALEAALAATSGRVEVGVRVEDADGAPPPSGPAEAPVDGRSYMRALSRGYGDRKNRRERQDRTVEALRHCLSALSNESQVSYLEPPGLVSVAHLIARVDEERYRSLIAEFAKGPGVGRVHVMGPWPPYSFATV